MKLKFLTIMSLAATLFGYSNNVRIDESGNPDYIGRHQMTIDNGRITPEVLMAFGRLGDIQISPNEKQILYGVGYYSVEQNKSNRELFVMNADGSNCQQITSTQKGEFNARWVKEGKKIAFLSAQSGSMQLWEMNPDGTERTQISNYEGGINDYLYSPDSKQVILITNVKWGERTIDRYPDLDKTSGIIVEDLMYKHWDEWVTTVPHPFLYDTTLTQQLQCSLVLFPIKELIQHLLKH